MPRFKPRNKSAVFAELARTIEPRLKPPFGIVLGSPNEVSELADSLPPGDLVCYQMDLFQARRLEHELRERSVKARVFCSADLWDLQDSVRTLIYPVAYGGERALKIDMVEQAFHALVPAGTFIVLSPYDHDNLFQPLVKKVFGKTHSPMAAKNAALWATKQGERERRRHEITFQVRVDESTSFRFISRPGVFSYGKMDDGARTLLDAARFEPGMRVLDLGCGVGAVGVIAGHRIRPDGLTSFVDSNLRAVALAELNAKAIGIGDFETFATADVEGPKEGSFDVVLANPPYFANLTIARHFIERSYAMLRKGGVLYLVSKNIDAIYPMFQQVFGDPEMGELRGYIIFEAVKR